MNADTSPPRSRLRRDRPSSESRDIDALVCAAAGGDRQAFATLYSIYRTEVHATVNRVLRRRSDAEDASQQVFLQALRALPNFDPQRGTFGAWIHAIAAHHAYSVLRHIGHEEAWTDAGAGEKSHDLIGVPGVDFLADEGFRLLLAPLSAEQRAVVVLRYQFGWPFAEIAATFERSVDAVGQLHKRALRRLRLAVPSATKRFV